MYLRESDKYRISNICVLGNPCKKEKTETKVMEYNKC